MTFFVEIPPDDVLIRRGGAGLHFLSWNQFASGPRRPIIDALMQRQARLMVFLDINSRLLESTADARHLGIELLDYRGIKEAVIPPNEYEQYWQKSSEDLTALNEQLKDIERWLPSKTSPIFLILALRKLAETTAETEDQRARHRTQVENFIRTYHLTKSTQSVAQSGDLTELSKFEPANAQQALEYVRRLAKVVHAIHGGMERLLTYLSRLDFSTPRGAPRKPGDEALLIYDKKECEGKSWGEVTRLCFCPKTAHDALCEKRLQEQHRNLKRMLARYHIQPTCQDPD